MQPAGMCMLIGTAYQKVWVQGSRHPGLQVLGLSVTHQGRMGPGTQV